MALHPPQTKSRGSNNAIQIYIFAETAPAPLTSGTSVLNSKDVFCRAWITDAKEKPFAMDSNEQHHRLYHKTSCQRMPSLSPETWEAIILGGGEGRVSLLWFRTFALPKECKQTHGPRIREESIAGIVFMQA